MADVSAGTLKTICMEWDINTVDDDLEHAGWQILKATMVDQIMTHKNWVSVNEVGMISDHLFGCLETELTGAFQREEVFPKVYRWSHAALWRIESAATR